MKKLITIPVSAESHANISREALRNHVSTNRYIVSVLFGDELIEATEEDQRLADAEYDRDKNNYKNGRPQKLNKSEPGEGRYKFLGLRVTEAQRSRIRRDARLEGLTVNAFISQALMLPITD